MNVITETIPCQGCSTPTPSNELSCTGGKGCLYCDTCSCPCPPRTHADHIAGMEREIAMCDVMLYALGVMEGHQGLTPRELHMRADYERSKAALIGLMHSSKGLHEMFPEDDVSELAA